MDAFSGRWAGQVAFSPERRVSAATADEEKGFQRAKQVFVSSTVSFAASPTTNGSTQHEGNTAFPASFASEWDIDTIGLIVLVVVLMIFFVAAKLSEIHHPQD